MQFEVSSEHDLGRFREPQGLQNGAEMEPKSYPFLLFSLRFVTVRIRGRARGGEREHGLLIGLLPQW